MARLSENSLRVRLGALQQASARFAMVPRNHYVTLLLMVPEEAVLQRADGEVVFRTGADNRVERVSVTTGLHRDGLVVVTSGLEPGDLVVMRGQAGLSDGVRVSPRNPDGTPIRTELSAADGPRKAAR